MSRRRREIIEAALRKKLNSDNQKARDFLVTLIETGEPKIFLPGKEFGELLIRKATDMGVAGIRIFDLQIGLLAVENGATTLWTHDAGFLPIPELTIRVGGGLNDHPSRRSG